MKVLKAKKTIDDKTAESNLPGKFLDGSDYDTLVDYNCDAFKPDGELLFKFRKNIIPVSLVKEGYRCLRGGARETNNRGLAGGVEINSNSSGNRKFIRDPGSSRIYPIKLDGTISKTNYAANNVQSGIVGYFDRNPRYPYCRLTAYTQEHYDLFKGAQPLIKFVSDEFKLQVSARWKAQSSFCQKTSKDFVIKDTVFTTITVNRNFRTATHKDVGDLKEGFGNLVVFKRGGYKGAYLVFPQYRIAVDLDNCDLLMMDVHEWHGNTAFEVDPGKSFERISLVMYYRQNMVNCGSVQEELVRAQKGIRSRR